MKPLYINKRFAYSVFVIFNAILNKIKKNISQVKVQNGTKKVFSKLHKM